LIDGNRTGGKFTAFLFVTPPGGGPGAHHHEREDEWFYIIEGRVSF
jgi:mannose-6-phosphate isomerase-like protein (cupin superfamily)